MPYGLCNAPATLHRPTIKKGVRALIGFISYYSIFIKNLANIANCLYNLTRKYVRFVWTAECQAAFELIKLLLDTPILAYQDPNLDSIIECDASLMALGAALAQHTVLVPISFVSRQLTPIE